MPGVTGVWRESASLILIARSVFSKTNYDYKFLCLKRSSKSDFMPSNYVFPGGNLSAADCDMKWLKLYENSGYDINSFEDIYATRNIPQVLMNGDKNSLPNQLAFRICAIRETFEECGVLLCKTRKIETGKSNWASYIGGSNLVKWQHLVHDNPEEFLNLCTQCEIYPDVWALKNWINWVTPATLKKRFNTLFFLATFNQVPHIQSDQREVENFMWTTPDECLHLNNNETIILPVPQFYEISRLRHFKMIEDLSNFAAARSVFGFESYWPYRIETDHGLFSLLPGDDLYPNEIDINKTKVDHVDELPHSNVKHRILHKNLYTNIIITEKFKSKSEHVVP